MSLTGTGRTTKECCQMKKKKIFARDLGKAMEHDYVFEILEEEWPDISVDNYYVGFIPWRGGTKFAVINKVLNNLFWMFLC